MAGFSKAGTDLDSLFEPRGTFTKRADVGFTIAGTDISNNYASASDGVAYGTTGFSANGTDIGTLFAAIGTGKTYWLQKSRRTDNTNSPVWYDAAVDSSGNIYLCGNVYNATTTPTWAYPYVRPCIAKYNKNGVLQWCKAVDHVTGVGFSVDNNYAYSGITITSSAIYVLGCSSSNSSYSFVAKFDLSGTLLWWRYWTSSASSPASYPLQSIRCDTNGDVIVFTYINYSPAIMKFNSSSTYQWAYKLSNYSAMSPSLRLDSSNNIYIYFPDGNLIKFPSNPSSVTWQKSINSSQTSNIYGSGRPYHAIDSSGNIYCVVFGYYGPCLVKYNSSGTAQWNRNAMWVGSSQIATGCTGVAIDPSGYIWLESEYAQAYFLKFDSSGNSAFGNTYRSFATNGSLSNKIYVKTMGFDSQSNLYWVGISEDKPTGTGYAAICKLRPDGTGTGSFASGEITYTSGNVTPSSITLTEGTSSVTISTTTNPTTAPSASTTSDVTLTTYLLTM